MSVCSVVDCGRPVRARGLCGAHYQRASLAGELYLYPLAERPTVDRTVGKDCPPDHKHGETHTCYNAHKCRCVGCRAAKSTLRRPYE